MKNKIIEVAHFIDDLQRKLQSEDFGYITPRLRDAWFYIEYFYEYEAHEIVFRLPDMSFRIFGGIPKNDKINHIIKVMNEELGEFKEDTI